MNATWGEAWANPLINSTSSATSPLGHVLTKGTFLGAGLHGTTPSGTSAYFSVDVGSIHIAALSTAQPSGIELDWLVNDLTAAAQPERRAKVPWIMVTSHYPIYNPTTAENAHCSAAAYESVSGEIADPAAAYRTCEDTGEGKGCQTIGEITKKAADTLTPLFYSRGVDVYNAGHSHEYGLTWPMLNGTFSQLHYDDPGQATVYITEGNGGVPGVPSNYYFKNTSVPWGRINGQGGAYGTVACLCMALRLV